MRINKFSSKGFFVLGCFFSIPVYAQSSVTIYGLADAGIEVSRSGNGTLSRLISGGTGGSRVGYRGVENIGKGWDVLFNLETGLALDTGAITQGGKGFGRAANIGLKKKELGIFQIGLINLPYYAVQSKVDAFDWRGNGGLMAISIPKNSSVELVMPVTTSARASNSISFTSDIFNGFQLRILGALSEKSSEQGNTYSIAGSYKNTKIEIVAGYAGIDSAEGSIGKAKAYVVGGNFSFANFKVFSGYTIEKNDCLSCVGSLKRRSGLLNGGGSDFRILNLGMRYPVNKTTFIAQFTRVQDNSEYIQDNGSRNVNWLSIGAEHQISKRTSLYSSISTLKNKNGSGYAIGSGTASAQAGSVAGFNPRATSAVVGIRHIF